MSNREPFKSGDFSLGLIHEFASAFGKFGGSPQMLRRITENRVLMSRVVDCIESGGMSYNYSDQERKAMEILGPDNVLNPALTLLAWTYMPHILNPDIRYSEKTIRTCAEQNRIGQQTRDHQCPLYWKWKLIYVHGLSIREQTKQHGEHFVRWSDDDNERLLRKDDKAEWVTSTFESGYYLVNYTALESGGSDYRKRQDKLLNELGPEFERVPINVLSEAALSLHYSLGEKHSEFGFAAHWSDQKAMNGNFLSLEIKVEGYIHKKTLEFKLSDAPVGKSWTGNAFVGRHGMCVLRKHDK